MAVYAAMIDQIDVHTGRVVDYLRDSGQLDNTLIVFLSDNGPEGHDLDETWSADVFPAIRKVIDERHDFSYANMGRPGSYVLYGAGWARAGSAGLRMYKAFPSEGGTRVAAFAYYPAGMKGQRIAGEPVSVLDIAPTVLAAAGLAPPAEYRGRPVHAMQRQSLLPLFAGLTVLAAWQAFAQWQRSIETAAAELRAQGLATERIAVVSKDVMDVYPRKVCFLPHSGKAMVKRLAATNTDALVSQERAALRQAAPAVATGGSVDLF